MWSLYLLGRQQQGLDWLQVPEELCLLNDVDIILKADGFVQGTAVCKVRAKVTDPPQKERTVVHCQPRQRTITLYPLHFSLARNLATDGIFVLQMEKEKPLAKSMKT